MADGNSLWICDRLQLFYTFTVLVRQPVNRIKAAIEKINVFLSLSATRSMTSKNLNIKNLVSLSKMSAGSSFHIEGQIVPPTRLSTVGDRAFPTAASCTWKSSITCHFSTISTDFQEEVDTIFLFSRIFPVPNFVAITYVTLFSLSIAVTADLTPYSIPN